MMTTPVSPPSLPAPLPPPPSPSAASAASARSGPGLLARLAAASAPPRVSSESSPGRWAALAPPGTRVWVLLRGKLGLKDVAIAGGAANGAAAATGTTTKAPAAWPAVLFSMSRVPKADVPLVLQTFNPRISSSSKGKGSNGRALVLFYGERSLMWCRLGDLEPWVSGFGGSGSGGDGNGGGGSEEGNVVAARLSVLRASSSGPRVARRIAQAAADAIGEAMVTLSDPEGELERAARARAAGALAAATGGGGGAGAGGGGGGTGGAEAAVPAAVAAADAAVVDEPEQQIAAEEPTTTPLGLEDPNVYCCHPACRETISVAEERAGTCVRCDRCRRQAHALCLTPPALKREDLTEAFYDCPGCGAPFSPRGGGLLLAAASPSSAAAAAAASSAAAAAAATAGGKRAKYGGGGGGKSLKLVRLRCSGRVPALKSPQQEEKMGLTPDRIIEGAIRVFGLEMPTPDQPFVRGLCDPCTNSMTCPNIPAERLYCKRANGLLLSNPWAGFHVLLNPEFSANIAHRFVARAVDEVENGSCRSVLLVCRNSTDTRYFQRLRPYPRVHLLRSSIMFKDYDKTVR